MKRRIQPAVEERGRKSPAQNKFHQSDEDGGPLVAPVIVGCVSRPILDCSAVLIGHKQIWRTKTGTSAHFIYLFLLKRENPSQNQTNLLSIIRYRY